MVVSIISFYSTKFIQFFDAKFAEVSFPPAPPPTSTFATSVLVCKNTLKSSKIQNKLVDNTNTSLVAKSCL